MDIIALTPTLILSYFLIFLRISSCMMVIPGVGERYIPTRFKLLLSLMVALVCYPMTVGYLPDQLPNSVIALSLLMIKEIIIGVFFGLMARILINASHIAGMIIGYQSGLATAVLFDPNTGAQGSAIGSFLTLIAITLFIATDAHHLLLLAVVDSYRFIAPDTALMIGDMSEFITTIVAESFLIAVKISSPFIVIGLLMYLAAGIMSRIMPNMQIFFVLMPIQILLGFVLLAMILIVTMMWYMETMQEIISTFIS